jgi:hypothetical protein
MTERMQKLTKLTQRQRSALPFLASAPSLSAGCRDAGISRELYYRWLKQPAFAAALETAQEDRLQQALQFLERHTTAAVSKLVELLETQNEALRRMVCLDIIGLTSKATVEKEITSRLSALEQALMIQSDIKQTRRNTWTN